MVLVLAKEVHARGLQKREAWVTAGADSFSKGMNSWTSRFGAVLYQFCRVRG